MEILSERIISGKNFPIKNGFRKNCPGKNYLNRELSRGELFPKELSEENYLEKELSTREFIRRKVLFGTRIVLKRIILRNKDCSGAKKYLSLVPKRIILKKNCSEKYSHKKELFQEKLSRKKLFKGIIVPKRFLKWRYFPKRFAWKKSFPGKNYLKGNCTAKYLQADEFSCKNYFRVPRRKLFRQEISHESIVPKIIILRKNGPEKKIVPPKNYQKEELSSNELSRKIFVPERIILRKNCPGKNYLEKELSRIISGSREENCSGRNYLK